MDRQKTPFSYSLYIFLSLSLNNPAIPTIITKLSNFTGFRLPWICGNITTLFRLPCHEFCVILCTMTQFQLTFRPNVYDPTVFSRQQYSTWAALVGFFGRHRTLSDKMGGQLFGPYTLREGATACYADQVAAVTLAVFDVDKTTPERAAATEATLERAGVARIWYSSYSHRPDAPAYRLILPLSAPIAPNRWATFRELVAHKYDIPFAPAECKGVNHNYFLPSHPPGAAPYFNATHGSALPADGFLATPALPYVPLPAGDDEIFPAEGSPLEDLRARILEVAARRTMAGEHTKAHYLRACVAGEALGTESRNEKTKSLVAMLVYNLHPQPFDTYLALVAPSVERMQADGSSLRDSDVHRMIRSAARKFVASQREDEEFFEAHRKAREQREAEAKKHVIPFPF